MGQSLIELALTLPILLIMISGLVEFGFALNQYLNSLDAAREAARFSTDSDPLNRDLPLGVTNTDCGSTADFYMQAACVAEQTLNPIVLDPTRDDVVLSVFRVLSSTVIGRWPDCLPDPARDCPYDPPPFPETMGEWHLFGRGDQCANGLDDDGDGTVDDGCPSIDPVGGGESSCDPVNDVTCHPSRITDSFVTSRLDPQAPDTAVIVVELFYRYPQVLKLPWITPFVPDPLPMHSYTILPLPAAEPSLTITGTVTIAGTGQPKAGVTIDFGSSIIAVTDQYGQYSRTGLSSGTYTLTPQLELCSFVPGSQQVALGITNVYNVDFTVTCPTPVPTATATNTPTATATDAPPDTPTATLVGVPSDTPTATPTATATATTAPPCVPGAVSASNSTVVSEAPTTVLSDGSAAVNVRVTVRDACTPTGNPLPGKTVTLSSSRGGAAAISPASAVTDGSGQAVFQVRSSIISDWDAGIGWFTSSALTAVTDGVTINDRGQATFICVRGEANPAGSGTAGNNNTDVSWIFSNQTGSTRRLVQLNVDWTHPDVQFEVQRIAFLGDDIWSQVPGLGKPAVINSGFQHNRTLLDLNWDYLTAYFNFPVTGGWDFTLEARWDNGTSGPTCSSGPVTVHVP